MGTVACKDCGAQVSPSAKACPKCGAPPPKGTSTFTWVVGIFFALMVFVAVQHSNDPPVKAAPVDPRAEDRFAAAKIAAVALKTSMRDPESFGIDSMFTNASGTIVCTVYHARNGFGGMNRDMLVLVDAKVVKDAARIKSNCSLATFDLTAITKVALSP